MHLSQGVTVHTTHFFEPIYINSVNNCLSGLKLYSLQHPDGRL